MMLQIGHLTAILLVIGMFYREIVIFPIEQKEIFLKLQHCEKSSNGHASKLIVYSFLRNITIFTESVGGHSTSTQLLVYIYQIITILLLRT